MEVNSGHGEKLQVPPFLTQSYSGYLRCRDRRRPAPDAIWEKSRQSSSRMWKSWCDFRETVYGD